MTEHDRDQAVELLQDLGLKTYEARSFTALNQLGQGTAKDISEVTDVPRTRVYDAMESLERRGLVEIHQGTPKRYRSIPLDEAIETIREQYESQLGQLEHSLRALDQVSVPEDGIQEVWFLTGSSTIEARMCSFIDGAGQDIRLAIESPECWTDRVRAAVSRAVERGVDVELLIPSSLRSAFADLPDRGIRVTEIQSLTEPSTTDLNLVGLSLLLTDGEAVVLEYHRQDGQDDVQAIYAEGESNGLVVFANRYLRSLTTE